MTDTEDAIPTLDQLSPRGREIATEYYAAGYTAGIAMGAQQVYDAWHARAEVSAAIARQIASTPPYADLCERRGEMAKADAARALLIERGIAA